MSNFKQATLFSLKSWKQVATDDIKIDKCILENKKTSEMVLVKTILSLKKKKPSKAVVTSLGLDSVLKSLGNHSDKDVARVTQDLMKEWNIPQREVLKSTNSENQLITKDIRNSSSSHINIMIPPAKELIIPAAKKVNHPPVKEVNNPPAKQVNNPPAKEVNNPPIKEVIVEKPVQNCVPNKPVSLPKKRPVAQCDETPNGTCKKSRLLEMQYTLATKQLQSAIQLFTRELGEQEVRLYLEDVQ